MTLTIVETCAITGGVDTHADVHVAAALDPIGGLLGVQEFPATVAGYSSLLGWLGGFGTVCLVGIEGTGSYGAGLARHVTAAGVRVVEVDRPDRQDRRRQGKSDPLDAVSAERTQTINQARSLIVTVPDDLRARFARHTAAALVAETAALRPRPGSTVGYATRITSRMHRPDAVVVPRRR